MKLFVDDYRNPPGDGFSVVRNYNKTIILLDLLDFDVISLDYDLNDVKNGLDIIQYIHQIKKYPKHLNIHSTHPTGSIKMYDLAKRLFPKDVLITRNSI